MPSGPLYCGEDGQWWYQDSTGNAACAYFIDVDDPLFRMRRMTTEAFNEGKPRGAEASTGVPCARASDNGNAVGDVFTDLEAGTPKEWSTANSDGGYPWVRYLAWSQDILERVGFVTVTKVKDVRVRIGSLKGRLAIVAHADPPGKRQDLLECAYALTYGVWRARNNILATGVVVGTGLMIGVIF